MSDDVIAGLRGDVLHAAAVLPAPYMRRLLPALDALTEAEAARARLDERAKTECYRSGGVRCRKLYVSSENWCHQCTCYAEWRMGDTS